MSNFGRIVTAPTERHFNNHSLCIQDRASAAVRRTDARLWRGFWHHVLWPKHHFVTAFRCQTSAAEIAAGPGTVNLSLSYLCSAVGHKRPGPLSSGPLPANSCRNKAAAVKGLDPAQALVADLRLHPLTARRPEMRPEAWRAFGDDGREHGVLEPLRLASDGATVLDGRHRLRAAREPSLEAVPTAPGLVGLGDEAATFSLAALMEARRALGIQLGPSHAGVARQRLAAATRVGALVPKATT